MFAAVITGTTGFTDGAVWWSTAPISENCNFFLFDDITNENCVVQNPTEPSENTSNNVGAKGLWFPGKITDGAGGR